MLSAGHDQLNSQCSFPLLSDDDHVPNKGTSLAKIRKLFYLRVRLHKGVSISCENVCFVLRTSKIASLPILYFSESSENRDPYSPDPKDYHK